MYTEIFVTMTSSLWRQLYLEHRQSLQYFAQQFSLTTWRCLRALRVTRKENKVTVNHWTCLNVNIIVSFFPTYRPNSF